ncbi:MAG TPA: alpha-amylase family glycosyl hydrolase [Rubrivivax sp.]|nr:alpha-amylase family glycosyl hydrolase [Rubrivivax sp.]
MQYANRFDIELQGVFETREKDWRNGAVVYQVLVDRFAPAADLAAKRHLYPAPKTLHPWQETPAKGRYLPEHRLWSHELAFWGGDLASTAARLGYVQDLGADVLYLNPIFHALTNHKYDALDYLQVAPEYGTRADVRALADDLHGRGMKLVLDGVFNHMGRNSKFFQQAQADENSHYRDWFVFDASFEGGARAWWRAQNLPELNLENPRVREHIYAAHDSVLRSYLRDGVDGWRLDVAFDIGFVFLEQLTRASHQEKAGSLVVGEIANYPKEWFPSVDAVMQFVLRGLTLRLVDGELDAPTYGRMLTRLVEETGIENMLKSWIYLDNHDTPRLATTVPDRAARRLAQVLQFTLPGSPNLYYGSELDMAGGDDPEMRAPMRWDLATPDNATLQWTRQLIRLHREHRALRVGNYRPICSNRLLAFERYTDRAADTVLVIANPGDTEISETLMVANSKLMDSTRLVDLLDPTSHGSEIRVRAALLQLTMPPRSVRVLKPDTEPDGGYSSYKRVR